MSDPEKSDDDSTDDRSTQIAYARVSLRVVTFLGAGVLLACLGASMHLFVNPDREVPNFFVGIGSACVGALAGVLTPQISSRK